jgi:integrase
MAEFISKGRNVWLVRIFMGRDPNDGKKKYENKTIHGTKKDAEVWAADKERERDLGVTVHSKSTVDVLFDSLLLDYKVNGKDYKWAEGVVRGHLRPFFGGMRIAKVESDTVRRYVAERQKTTAANGTINRELALLKRSFKLGCISTPPRVGRVPHISLLKENNVRKGFFEYADYIAILDALPVEVRPIVSFAYFTGCRRREVLSLRWAQVDLESQFVHLEKGTTKNGEARFIPLVPELVESLSAMKAARGSSSLKPEAVFTRDGKPIKNFRRAWELACIQCGFVDAEGKPSRLFHDLRRSCVRNLVRAGVSEAVAMKISGHKTRSIFDRYDITALADLKNAAEKLSRHTASQEQKPARSHTIVTPAVN